MDITGYKAKRCNSCATIYYPSISFFYKDTSNKDSLSCHCKKCRSIQKAQYCSKNKKKIKAYQHNYRIVNKNKISKNKQDYYIKNKKRIKARRHIYVATNKEKINKKGIIYRLKNRIARSQRVKKYSVKDVTYSRLKGINKYEHIRKHPEIEGIGQIKCAYCGKWMTPTGQEYLNRRREIFQGNGGCLIYCSTQCKIECPTYRQTKHIKGNKIATSREVNPLIRQMCFGYDNYTCQKCYKKENIQLHCHHIQGAVKEPLLSNDIDNVITFCKECHERIHQKDGCSYIDYRRKQCA